MTIRVGINGFGRIGRNFFRAAKKAGADIDFVAVNDLGSVETMAHLLKYDSVMGQLEADVEAVDDGIKVGGDTLKVLAVRDPKELPWGDLGVDVVVESTGIFTARDKAALHLDGGAPFVVVSAPSSGADGTFVVGVNDDTFDGATQKVVSNASCTTNCFVPMVKVLDDAFGVERGLMTTVHAYTNDQNLIDNYHKGSRRGRSAPLNMVITETGAAKAVSKALPELKGKLSGNAIRVPTPNVSMAILNLNLEKDVTVDSANNYLREMALHSELQKQIDFVNSPEVVSTDFVGSRHAGVVDAQATIANGKRLILYVWYDNEFGYSAQVIRCVNQMAGITHPIFPKRSREWARALCD